MDYSDWPCISIVRESVRQGRTFWQSRFDSSILDRRGLMKQINYLTACGLPPTSQMVKNMADVTSMPRMQRMLIAISLAG